MRNKENEVIIQKRNKAALYVDDLVALIKNSILASEVRDFSKEIMELTPNFAFGHKKANALLKLARETYKQYLLHEISDDDVLGVCTKARMMIEQNEMMNGGQKMNISEKIDRIIHGKKYKQETKLMELNIEYDKVVREIDECKEKMDRCVKNSQGHEPGSIIYRNNERNYKAAENKMALLKKTEKMLEKAIDEAIRIKQIETFSKATEDIARATNFVLGTDKELDETITKTDINMEKTGKKVDSSTSLGKHLFENVEEERALTDSDFGARVAEAERRQATLENAGVSIDELYTQEASVSTDSEFDIKVKALKDDKEEK